LVNADGECDLDLEDMIPLELIVKHMCKGISL